MSVVSTKIVELYSDKELLLLTILSAWAEFHCVIQRWMAFIGLLLVPLPGISRENQGEKQRKVER